MFKSKGKGQLSKVSKFSISSIRKNRKPLKPRKWTFLIRAHPEIENSEITEIGKFPFS